MNKCYTAVTWGYSWCDIACYIWLKFFPVINWLGIVWPMHLICASLSKVLNEFADVVSEWSEKIVEKRSTMNGRSILNSNVIIEGIANIHLFPVDIYNCVEIWLFMMRMMASNAQYGNANATNICSYKYDFFKLYYIFNSSCNEILTIVLLTFSIFHLCTCTFINAILEAYRKYMIYDFT